MSDHDDILKLLREREAAVARGDAAGSVAMLSDQIVTYDLAPPLRGQGAGAEAAAGLDEWFKTWTDGVTSELVGPEIRVSGDLAVVWGLEHMRGDKVDQGPVDMWSRSTLVLERHSGQWRIVHEHNSVPMMMDGSGQAATDLKP